MSHLASQLVELSMAGSKRGEEVNGFNAKVVVAMDARLHESLCRLAMRKRRPMAAMLRDVFAREVQQLEEGDDGALR